MKKLYFLIVLIFLLVSFNFSFSEEGVTPEYKISANDLLEINVYGEPDLNKIVRVAIDGKVSYPLLNSVEAKGLTAKELEKKIGDLLQQDYLVNPQVHVFVKEFAKILILGQIKLPGSYQLKSGMKVMDAIALAGGFTDKANPEDVKLVREENGQKETIDINTKDIVAREAADKDVDLLPNDLIVVGSLSESSSSIIVLGQVKRPGRYDYKKGMTVLEAIAAAGGLTDTAASNSTKVIRENKNKKQTFSVPVGSLLKGGSGRDMVLEPEDKIIVPESFF